MSSRIEYDRVAMRHCRELHMIRQERGYTLDEFARLLGVSPVALIRLELHPEACGVELYNVVAGKLGWELSVGGES